MQDINLDIYPSSEIKISDYENLYNISEKNAISVLKDREIGSWIFRFDYITQKYYITIRSSKLGYINHHIYYSIFADKVYLVKNNIISNDYLSLQEYIINIQDKYKCDIIKQIKIV